MKRTISMLLAVLMLFALTAGCGNTAEEPSPGTGAAETVSPSTDDKPNEGEPEQEQPSGTASMYPLDEPVTLTAFNSIYQPRTGGKVESWDETLPYVTAAERTNIYIEMECVATDAQQQQTLLLISAETYPDLWTNLNTYYGSAERLVEDGICIDLSPYLDEYAPDYMAAVREGGYEKDIVSDSGLSVALYNISEGFASTGMMIRKDWLDELGLDIPVTYDDYEEILEAFKVEKGAAGAFALDATSVGSSDVFNAGFGVQLYSHPIMGSGNDGFYQVDGKIKFGYLEDGFVEFITLMHDWYEKGYISPDYVVENENLTSETFLSKVMNGEIGVLTNGRNVLETIINGGKDLNPDFDMVPIAAPTKTPGEQLHLAPYRQSALSQNSFYVSSTCENVEAALLWHNYWFTEEGHMLSNYGVEGMTYEMVDGKPVFTDFMLDNPDGLTINQTSYIYIGQLGVVDSSRENQWYSDVVVESADIWGSNMDNDWKIPGTVSMTPEESEKYSQTFSDIKTYISESLPKFVNGELSLDTIDEFMSWIREMGIEECMDIWQTALDRYNARRV